MLFFYEFSTALLLRVLQLSIPNQKVAIFVSIFGALMEMAVRVFFFVLFLIVGLKKDGQWASAGEVYAYALRAKLRVMDSNNDMV